MEVGRRLFIAVHYIIISYELMVFELMVIGC